MAVTLEDILDLPDEWQTAHAIRALAVNGKSLALDGLQQLQRKHAADYRKLFLALRQVAERERVHSTNHVKRGQNHREIYEARGGQARLFFFYTPDKQKVVVCTHTFYKAKSSSKEQDQEFAKADRLRELYLSHGR